MLSILVINSKGGSGKTTLATNLASYFAWMKNRTAMMDYDPQGSSMQWLKIRSGRAENIHGSNAAPAKGASSLRSIQAWLPPNTEVLVIDAPAGANGLLLQELVRRSNFIVIPVAPSPIDIHATADFIKELYLFGGARSAKAKIAVVANRVRSPSSQVYAALERFLNSLKLPFLTTIRDSDNYLHAFEKGLGVFEIDEGTADAERRELMPILKWLNSQFPTPHAVRFDDQVLGAKAAGKLIAFRRDSLNTAKFNSTGNFKY